MGTANSDKVALVTGAAGGIGRAVVLALAGAGAPVAAVDIDGEALGGLERQARDEGLNVAGFAADITSAAETEAAVAAAENRFGPIHHLVNTAGVLCASPALELTEEDWERTFAVNTTAVFRVSATVTRRMVAHGVRGAVVTVASNAANVPRMNMSAYSASKAAAAAWTKNLGLELAAHGIRCNVVGPGSTDTPMLRSLWTDASGPSGSLDGVPSQYRLGIPLGRFASPADIADAVTFLLSDRAAHITMHDLIVDGGATLGR
ncbi:2,3-dihydro-2,3-dihydroxybenzoate dehydrogenase [Streptomyces albidoflavus]|uniref:2,3-dihydro-2,3-dihydroxybenzoate dehydrogenase n=1 Tax=Streptomyces albidoflavus TaxID=1886 RepID=UPI0004C4BC55|nr:2,3-dihydro-2,3-dihydroxybenzoate dehydrogenase [Streptomyces albidoflavus]RZD87877.1 2,3-dihydro-2,3-dihydroxybenzoate dehydrogenase [Streptomyces albidoflavus]RZE03352.1 2,3-dihydro-2,3-dihydroxybenzoate dehydrogenase [Streptomyces albidoflavus]RZE65910.1 2,3-dihydro-2,3-dihydroxybenzoate dehydrogenase [Streptomyces albidoflavus]RZE68449.1 2,3-dihydro-2,3-dihydroxybenzoate dehydrogenase [Streptomyces albidoflavus]RZE84677.1 2,3-dihydro-2,3-dihydroxybenzoate dehydrogenase [Streptomyces alb